MIVCETKRLVIRHFELRDAQYIVNQLNQESFIRFIADKKVRNVNAAQKYLKEGPMASYQKFGFGMNIILLKHSDIPIGMCGLVKRDELEYPDLGYAFLPEYWGKGYAAEASIAILNSAVNEHGLNTILGITLADNQTSNCLLTRLGFTQKGIVDLYGSENNLYEYQPNNQLK
jgi:RimJ/RimL family protein N-acetyltransferase